MRYYWEVLFTAEYFPYWEFSMLMMLALQLSQLWRLHRIEQIVETERSANTQLLEYLMGEDLPDIGDE